MRRSAGYREPRAGVIIFVALAVALAAFVTIMLLTHKKTEEEVDPHEGQVYIYDGFDWIWMTPLAGVPVNTLTEDMFTANGTEISYIGNEYDVLRGIDVSEHQYDIDWEEVAASGVDYAYIRVGRRGYTEGGLFEDPYFEANITGAQAAGLKIGVYMFSQAVTVAEAIEEANFVIDRIKNYNVALPVVFDWEKIEDDGARTANIAMEGRTDCAVAFCETIKNAGYIPGVYFNRNLGYYGYDLRRLTDYEFWFSLPESSFPNFYYAADMWQYSFTESVPGIEGETDMNLWFIPKNTEAETGE
jgi:lysozyme